MQQITQESLNDGVLIATGIIVKKFLASVSGETHGKRQLCSKLGNQ
jgi:hypothetical protein